MFEYKSVVEGKAGIVARVVAKSKSSVTGKEITTFECEYPRFVHSELLTHRMLSRNAASSRAIPITKTIEQVSNNPAYPVHWGKNQPGMQAKEELVGEDLDAAKKNWFNQAKYSAEAAEAISSWGAHKQIVNRVLEPFVFMKTVITATEWNNFFYLRDHEDADPTIAELARVMKEAISQVEAEVLEPGEWHVPYYMGGYWTEGSRGTLAEALAVSSSCCAQVSFRLLDTSLEKADKIYDRLVNSKPVHASPFEHQSTPMEGSGYNSYLNNPEISDSWQEGITHYDKHGNFWSANFNGWIQHRQLIPGNVVEG